MQPFQQVVDEYWRDVARLAAALAHPNDVDDAIQRTWLQALRAYPTLRHSRNLRGWLLTIAARAAADGHRARRRNPTPVAHMPEEPPEGPATGYPQEGDEDLWPRVRNLPERQRTAVALRYVLDLPHADIARMLGTTETATRRLVSDALATLRKDLRKESYS